MKSISSAQLLPSQKTPEAIIPCLHIPAQPAAHLQAVVIIPVKDEAEQLPAALAALSAQVDLEGRPLPPGWFEVLVLANNCQDSSAAEARRFAADHPHMCLHVAEISLPPAEAHIGRARRLLMDEACRRLELVGHPAGFIASTDGDTCVASTWLAATQRELRQFAVAAVCGRILTPTRPRSSLVRRYHLRDAAYRLLQARLEAELDPNPNDPWPRHHQHFGASFAITAAAYRQVGGLPVVPYLEDEALYRALRRHDLSVRHSPAVRVLTSDRQQGRVAVGLSWQLREWELLAGQTQPVVAGMPHVVATLLLRRHLRHLWLETQAVILPEIMLWNQHYGIAPVAEELGVSRVALLLRLRQATTFGQLWEWIEQDVLPGPAWARRWQPVPLSQGLQELRLRLFATRAA
ncbi:glycosyltransferase [Hymenobacter metallicola]|uniref:Glycosyltransferase n=1 Tax=Hymenobacter metallicola TaxID=2563114 RepID=A0A4Z0PTQ3_9BACT|nr:glycosyltransferase [Hymenobacter metallicola]TGE21160.1 glycosyltransferase [Hymenobacter metallicola]